jgi:5-methylcytosine-specific restriction endonuclease McrA
MGLPRGPRGPYKGRAEYAATTAAGRGAEWRRLRLKILERDGYRCAYCGAWADTVDHIVPKNRGGTDVESNLVACCRKCNCSKQDRVAPAAPRRRPALPEW